MTKIYDSETSKPLPLDVFRDKKTGVLVLAEHILDENGEIN